MTNPITFNPDDAHDHVTTWRLWPVGDDGAGERDWWTRLMQRVTDALNEHDWNDEAYPEDKVTELVERAVANSVAEARSARRVLRLCEVSGVNEVMDDPFDDPISSRLIGPLIETDPTRDIHPLRGEDHYSEEYIERIERARAEHHDQVRTLLRLGNVAEVYLTGAAEWCARDWATGEINRWTEANPEPDDDEDEERKCSGTI